MQYLYHFHAAELPADRRVEAGKVREVEARMVIQMGRNLVGGVLVHLMWLRRIDPWGLPYLLEDLRVEKGWAVE